MPDHNYFSNLIWQIDERVMLPMTVLRRFDCVLAPTKARVLAEHAKRKGSKLEGDALDTAKKALPVRPTLGLAYLSRSGRRDGRTIA